jgi:hypothetical protein
MQLMTKSLVILLIALSCLAVVEAQNSYSTPKKAFLSGRREPNLFEEIMERKDQLSWEFHEEDALPTDLCKILLTNYPDKKLHFKILGFPLGTPKSADGAALVLSWTGDQNHPDIVMLANATHNDASFFLLSREGTLEKTAYRTGNGPWVLISNALGHNEFERQKGLWHDWLVSLTALKHSTTMP